MIIMISAGILFVQNNHILCGYNTKEGKWSGLGGKCEENEASFITAIRETIEELFGITLVLEQIHILEKLLKYKSIQNNNSYIFYEMNIDNIFVMANFLKDSPYYDSLPKNIVDLLCNRKYVSNQEITYLEFVSKKFLYSTSCVQPFFKKDTALVYKDVTIDGLNYII